MKRSRNKIKTRKEIILAAEQLFAERGYADTSMRDLAGVAQIRSSTLYHYFESKNALFIAVLEDFYTELAELYGEIERGFESGVTLRRALVTFLAAHQSFIETRPNFSAIFLFEGVRPGSPMASHVTGLTEKIAAPLRRMAARFPLFPQETVVSLFLAMVGINLFFQNTQEYQERIAGGPIDGLARLQMLSALLDGTGEFTPA